MNLILAKLEALFNPEHFQGWGKKRRYFEGWYFKILNLQENRAFAVIPGVAMDEEGNRQAFIQVLDGIRSTAEYHRFNYEDFHPSSGTFELRIRENHFSDKFITLDLPGLKGHLEFTGNKLWPNPWYSPGIMGPYTFAPFMECYHGIVSMDHSIIGKLDTGEESINFDHGRGYIEKDWGRSFPSWYIWMQSNHFSEPGISLKSSVANIPWIRNSFTGFIAGLQIHDRLYRFTTYNGTKLCNMASNEIHIEIMLENRQHRLEIFAKRGHTTPLASPVRGFMDGRIEQSMTGEVQVKLTDIKGKRSLLEDTGRKGAIEVMGV